MVKRSEAGEKEQGGDRLIKKGTRGAATQRGIRQGGPKTPGPPGMRWSRPVEQQMSSGEGPSSRRSQAGPGFGSKGAQ